MYLSPKFQKKISTPVSFSRSTFSLLWVGSEFMMKKMLPFESTQDWFQGAGTWAGPGEHPSVLHVGPTTIIRTRSKSTCYRSLPSWIQSLELTEEGKDSFPKSCPLTSAHVHLHTHMHITHTQCNKKFFLKSQELSYFYFMLTGSVRHKTDTMSCWPSMVDADFLKPKRYKTKHCKKCVFWGIWCHWGVAHCLECTRCGFEPQHYKK